MNCITLKPYNRACAPVTGGVSDIAIFDPLDLDFTQAAAVDGVVPAYTAVAAADGAAPTEDDGLVLPVSFQFEEAEYKWKQSRKGCSVQYEHELDFTLPQNSHAITNFLQAIDSAACCCGIGVFIRLNDGKIFVMGERIVGGTQILKFIVTQDGSDGTSGKVYDDENAANIVLKGDYSRGLYEYTGTWQSILDLNTVTP